MTTIKKIHFNSPMTIHKKIVLPVIYQHSSHKFMVYEKGCFLFLAVGSNMEVVSNLPPLP